MPGSFRSSRYFAAPVIMRGSSTRFMRAPKTFVVVSSTWVVMASPHRRRVDGLDDVLVAGAAADVALEPAPDLRIGEPVAVRAEELDAGHDHPRRAEAALERVVLPEGLLERMELAGARETLDRRDLAAVGLDGEHGAGLHRAPAEVEPGGRADADARLLVETELVEDRGGALRARDQADVAGVAGQGALERRLVVSSHRCDHDRVGAGDLAGHAPAEHGGELTQRA